MTTTSTSHIQLNNTLGLLGVFLAIAVLTGCKPDFGNLGPCAVCFGPPQGNLEGTLSGLAGSGLVLANESQYSAGFTGAAANGTQVVFGDVPVNAAYNLTVQTQPTNPAQTCVVTNGAGTAGTMNVTNIAVTCTTNPPRFAYVANRGSNNISAYTVDPTSGALAAIPGSPIVAGNLPVAIAVDPTGSYAYVVNQMDATLSAFLIDRNSGALTEVSGSPFATGLSPTSVAIDPSSSFVYVANGGAASVSAYAITAASGSLTALTGSPYAAGNSPSAVAVDAVGGYVYVTNKADGTFSAFEIEAGAGVLAAPLGPFAAGQGPQAVVTDPTGQFIYIASATSNEVFSIFLNDGTAMRIGLPLYPTGSTPYSLAVDPLGRFLYVANQGSDNLSGFALLAGSGLAALATPTFATGSEPSSVAVENTGKFAYVVNTGSGTVSVYSIDATTGALTPIGGSPFVTGFSPSAIAISD